MNSNKGTLITIIVIIAVILLGIVLWWSQMSNLPGPLDTGTPVSEVPPADDTTARIQADLNQVDVGDTNQEMQDIDADINTL
ncbi:MAG: hypothetical protein AAB691_01150 [Patescibacteria group bacterium]|mgnify:CR=1 FL=1